MWVTVTWKQGQPSDSGTEKALEEIKPQLWCSQIGDDNKPDAFRIPNNRVGYNNEHS